MQCSICQEDGGDFFLHGTGQGSHSFHKACVGQWVMTILDDGQDVADPRRPTCPMCRQDLTPEDTVDVLLAWVLSHKPLVIRRMIHVVSHCTQPYRRHLLPPLLHAIETCGRGDVVCGALVRLAGYKGPEFSALLTKFPRALFAADATTGCGYDMFHMAALWGVEEHLDLMLAEPFCVDVNRAVQGYRESAGFTALHVAARSNQSSVIKKMVGHQCIDVNARSLRHKRTPLMEAVTSHTLDGVIWLLGHPAIDVNAQDCNGLSALHLAVDEGKVDIVSALLSHKDIDAELDAGEGWTPLQAAVENVEGNCDCCMEKIESLLHAAGAD